MKIIQIPLEDKEHEKLVTKKKEFGLNWHDFVMLLVRIKPRKEEKNEQRN